MNFNERKYSNCHITKQTNCQEIFSYLIILLTFVSTFFLPSILYSAEAEENELVLAYLERFTRFIENNDHPEFDNSNQPFKLCVIGDNIFGEKIFEVFKQQKIKGRKVELQFVNNLEDINNANLLFITKTDKEKLAEIIKYANINGILTTSYTKGYARYGVHINLYMLEKKLKFEINNTSAKSAGFRISHLLLNYARIIE